MGLEQGFAGPELNQNACNAPDVTRKTPTQTKNDFWSTVMSGRDDGGVVFILEGS